MIVDDSPDNSFGDRAEFPNTNLPPRVLLLGMGTTAEHFFWCLSYLQFPSRESGILAAMNDLTQAVM